jgi:hypothetical protein
LGVDGKRAEYRRHRGQRKAAKKSAGFHIEGVNYAAPQLGGGRVIELSEEGGADLGKTPRCVMQPPC